MLNLEDPSLHDFPALSNSGRESGYFSSGHSPTYQSDPFVASPDLSTDSVNFLIRQRNYWAPEKLFFGTSDRLSKAKNFCGFEPNAQFRINQINETKYVTAIFEASDTGIEHVFSDVVGELQLWFEEEGLLGIACEVYWSVPECYRNRRIETQMKDGIHATLRKNNRHVMDLQNEDIRMPDQSVVHQNSYRDTKLDCFQGVYRRFYQSLLPLQHKETVSWHEDFWSLSDPLKLPLPDPAKFLLGQNPEKLRSTSLVAVNLIGLKVK